MARATRLWFHGSGHSWLVELLQVVTQDGTEGTPVGLHPCHPLLLKRTSDRQGGRSRGAVKMVARVVAQPPKSSKSMDPCLEPDQVVATRIRLCRSFFHRRSEALARVLRHTAQNLGIPIRGDGFCKLSAAGSHRGSKAACVFFLILFFLDRLGG